ncbi:dipeptidase [Sphingomonas sp. RG327]|uniref:Dipeptidase n=1 Tax=Sphingomonas anseongensis TaxID=2908207 RepID=A0ABT0RH68_9SPHN|nr:membrane dipeptidase [Sphingomonas anseongensis]MCL6679619.1 dipeptidase [Sphingomonas anseongensis]
MQVDRRTMMAGAVATIVAAPVLAKARMASSGGWYDRAIVIDALGGLGDPYGPDDAIRLSDRAWAEMAASGVTVLRDTVMPVGNVPDPWAAYQKDMGIKQQVLAANPDRLILVRTAADILKAKREKKFGVVIGTQDTSMIGGDLDRLAQMKKDGVMTVQLTYNNGNLAGDGSLEPRNGGLTKLGKATIDRIEKERLLLDLSHGGARTMAEAAAYAKRPLVISHTGARALADHPRNTSDETIKAVADKGGVVGVYFMPFLTLDSHPKGSDLVAHIEHVANVAGEDHVGLGSDNGVLPQDTGPEATRKLNEWAKQRMDAGIAAPGEGLNVWPMVADYNSVDRYRRLASDLQKRGWTEARLDKLFGGNFLRVYRDAWNG